MCSLVNVGVYAARTGMGVFAVNCAGAAVALIGYILLVPDHGVMGAIEATVAGQGTRLILFLVAGRRVAPIVYPWGFSLAIATIDIALAVAMRESFGLPRHALVILLAFLALGGLGWRALGANRSLLVKEVLA